MDVSIRNLSKSFGDTPVLENISLDIKDQELFFLLGPSGCGKTTLLRIIAGFYKPDAGELRFGEKLMNSVPPHERNTGMVFQNYALWPHLTVERNVMYGLDVRKLPGEQKMERVREALAIVQMEKFADRTPNQLSGGQQQRVALARALVIRPDVLLLDEPLSNLDAKLRLEMRGEIRRIHAQTRITMIYVTHDQKESLSLADRMAVMKSGRIEQTGDPRAVYRSPTNRFVADFIGETNWIEGIAKAGRIETSIGAFVMADNGERVGNVWLGFRPEAARFVDHSSNIIDAEIADVTYLGETEEYVLRCAKDSRIKVFEQNPRVIRNRGERIRISIEPESLLIYPR